MKLSSQFLPLENSDPNQLIGLDPNLEYIFLVFCKFVNVRGWIFYFMNVETNSKGQEVITGYLRENHRNKIKLPPYEHIKNFIFLLNMSFPWKPWSKTFDYGDVGFGKVVRIKCPKVSEQKLPQYQQWEKIAKANEEIRATETRIDETITDSTYPKANLSKK